MRSEEELTRGCLFAVGALAVFLFAAPAQANLIINGDFESGNTGFTTDFTYSPGGLLQPKVYDIVSNPSLDHPAALSYGDHTTGSGLMMAVNGTDTTVATVWSQTVAVSHHKLYDFSLWVSTWSNVLPDQLPGSLEVQFNGVPVLDFTAPSQPALWVNEDVTWNSLSNTSLTIGIINTSVFGNGNDFALDDISLDRAHHVPEPSSLLLVWLALVGLVSARRIVTASAS